MIVERILERRKSRIKMWPVRSNRASELGHDCLRYLVFMRTRWQEKPLHDVTLQGIFEEGNLHEEAVLSEIRNAGFRVIEQQRGFEWKEYEITGHIDAKILFNERKVVPIEIKSSSPYVWKAINSVEDLVNGKYMYLRKYPGQLNLYLLMDEKEMGMFVFKNKLTGQLKEIPMEIDYDLGEKLLQKAEAVNRHMKEGTVPDPIEYEEQVCGDCGFFHICLPDVVRDALELETDPELEGKLDRHLELKKVKADFDQLDKELKAKFKGQEKVVVGNWLITGKEVERKGCKPFWQSKFNRLEVKDGGSTSD